MAKRGFFMREEIAAKQRAAVAGEPRCLKCKLHKGCRSPKLGVSGKGGKGILFISTAPGAMEDQQGKHLVGKGGQRLRKELRKLGIDLDKDCWQTSAINCRPPDRRDPEPYELDACRPKVFTAINELQPKKIVLLGAHALDCFLATRWSEALGGIHKWRGWQVPDRDLQAWVYPTFDPDYVMRVENAKKGRQRVAGVAMANDLAAMATHDVDGIAWDWADDGAGRVTVCKDPDEINRWLREYLRAQELTAVDYETTGIKPWADGHAVYTAALANKSLGALSFPMYPEVVPSWKRILRTERVPKTAHVTKFEEVWGRARLGTRTRGWVFCSAQGSHVADNRRGVNSLKFQCYVRLGILNWGDTVRQYLESAGQDSNALNRIREANLDQLLLYGGKDVLYQLWLAHIIAKELGVALP